VCVVGLAVGILKQRKNKNRKQRKTNFFVILASAACKKGFSTSGLNFGTWRFLMKIVKKLRSFLQICREPQAAPV